MTRNPHLSDSTAAGAASDVGVEWDQHRIGYISAPAAPQSVPEFRATAARIKKVSDFAR